VFLSHQQTFGTTPTACIRFGVLSRIEILHILLERSYDSRRNRNALSSPTSWAAASREKPGSAQSRSDSSSGGLPSLDRLHTSSRRIRATSWRCLAAAIVAKSTRGRAGSRIPGALLAAAATGRCSCGVGHHPSGRLPADKSHRPRRRRFASKLLARPASQTASQSMRQPAIIWGHPRTMLTATAPLSGVSEITDTEEVTGFKSSIAHQHR
jgi:hypothetical protein